MKRFTIPHFTQVKGKIYKVYKSKKDISVNRRFGTNFSLTTGSISFCHHFKATVRLGFGPGDSLGVSEISALLKPTSFTALILAPYFRRRRITGSWFFLQAICSGVNPF